jgi:hypothetical protein
MLFKFLTHAHESGGVSSEHGRPNARQFEFAQWAILAWLQPNVFQEHLGLRVGHFGKESSLGGCL